MGRASHAIASANRLAREARVSYAKGRMRIGPAFTVVAVLVGTSVAVHSVSGGAPATLTVQADRPGARISPLLWGIFFEDINLSVDGGIYAELVRNRSFEDSDRQAEHWVLEQEPEGKSDWSIDTSRPLNPFNRRSLRIRLNGAVTLRNQGYWGMNLVAGETYVLSLAARSTGGFTGPLTVRLESQSGRVLAQGELRGLTDRWQTLRHELSPAETDPRGQLSVQANGKGTLWLDMVSLMPQKTWKGHGLRPDLCEMLAGLKPAFMRFPGGCWVEGDDVAHMYRWKDTVGDPAHRKPLWNLWGYWATHGVGFHEYLQLCEDLGAEPVFCINAGMSHREVVPLDQMGPWIQDALDAIEYANGPTNTVWGSLRARHGHPAPFNLKYVEIGNENGGPAYAERWALFYHAIKSRYPQVQLIANVWGGYPKDPPPDIVDEHYYNNPEFFMRQARKYDSYPRTGPKVFVGEYAVTSGAGQGNLWGALGEAAFMTGLERNGDVVVMAAYAPLFVNVHHKRWPINLINFDSSRVYGLPSYYVQQLFSLHRGDVVLPVRLEAPAWSAEPLGGAIGVGTWLTEAEFKDIRVTRNGETLFACDFAKGTEGWRLLGQGRWAVQDGVLRQSSRAENVRAITGDKGWTDYTYSLKARKLGGAEGFLILFGVQDDQAKSWWNLGGWGNRRHAIEKAGSILGEVDGRIETGRWYDIRIELKGQRVRCYLDNRLVHDVELPRVESLYASASLAESRGDIILKVVNVASQPIDTAVQIQGVNQLNSQAVAVVLTSDSPADENSLEQPTKVAPKTNIVQVPSPNFQYSFPAHSLTVLRLKPAR